MGDAATGAPARKRRLRPRAAGRLAALTLAAAVAGSAMIGAIGPAEPPAGPAPTTRPVPAASIGLNLFGLAQYYREPVFTNLLAQSEWFSSRGQGWTMMPASQIDAHGTIKFLQPGEFAPRPLTLPRPPVRRMQVRCTFAGTGKLSAGGVARLARQEATTADLEIALTGAPDENGWLQLDATAPDDPLRDLDCRDRIDPRNQVFDPAFVDSLHGFAAIRFLDWQRVNDNPANRWPTRVLPGNGTQAGPGGVAIEHMVALANLTDVDPWFLMPYDADDAYIAGFAAYVHDHLESGRTAYVELGNEVWNDQFAAATQARREGVALKLAADPFEAQMRRYADKASRALQIWTRAFADRPGRLVRVISSHNAYPEAAEMILGHGDVARWTDALATAPYITLDLNGRDVGDLDRIFADLPAAISKTLDFAQANRATATRYGKRFIAYEGGQHLVTRDQNLAELIQRDPRMGEVYTRYLQQWRARIGDRMMLYASTAPIGEFGSWGLREYAGQPITETPKLAAVRRFLNASR